MCTGPRALAVCIGQEPGVTFHLNRPGPTASPTQRWTPYPLGQHFTLVRKSSLPRSPCSPHGRQIAPGTHQELHPACLLEDTPTGSDPAHCPRAPGAPAWAPPTLTCTHTDTCVPRLLLLVSQRSAPLAPAPPHALSRLLPSQLLPHRDSDFHVVSA